MFGLERREFRPVIERLEDRNLPSFVSAISSPVFRPDNAAFGDFNGDGNLDFAAPLETLTRFTFIWEGAMVRSNRGPECLCRVVPGPLA